MIGIESVRREDTPVNIYNPLPVDVKVFYRDDENMPHIEEIPSLSFSTYPKYKADIFVKHIVDQMINERKLGYLTPEQRNELLKEIYL